MKKHTFLLALAISIVCINTLKAQVLYTETFDNFTLGNLGTDITGTTPGQGGWLTTSQSPQANNSNFTVTNETNKGKVLNLATPVNSDLTVRRPGIENFINQRTNGYSVIKFEIDYYTGTQYYQHDRIGGVPSILISLETKTGFLFRFNHMLLFQVGYITARYPTSDSSDKSINLGNNNGDSLPVDTWVTFIVYMDYNNKKIYFDNPYFGTVVSGDFLSNNTSTNLIDDFKPMEIIFYNRANTASNVQQMIHKYDNIKITALKSVPPEVIALSTTEQLAEKFNLYPNPATTVVNITNSENIQVNQVAVYDIAGKQLSTQSFTNQTEIQLNVENLASGAYLLHLQTQTGTAVKKLIKN